MFYAFEFCTWTSGPDPILSLDLPCEHFNANRRDTFNLNFGFLLVRK